MPPASCVTSSSMPRPASNSRARRSVSRQSMPPPRVQGRRGYRPAQMFSATDRFGSRWLSWCTALMPSSCACNRRVVASPVCPSSSMLPASGAYTPVSTLISVDLPAPFCPMSACTSPARSVSSTPASACTPGKAREMSRASSTIARVVHRGHAAQYLRVWMYCFAVSMGKPGFLDDDALGDRPARHHFGHRGHELRAEQADCIRWWR